MKEVVAGKVSLAVGIDLVEFKKQIKEFNKLAKTEMKKAGQDMRTALNSE